MLQESYISVSLKAKQDSIQLISDVKINYLYDIQRVIFFYGREYSRKIKILVYYIIYKNIVYFSPYIFFGVLDIFSGSMIYYNTSANFYNIFFTLFPILFYVLLDQKFSNPNSEYLDLYKKQAYFIEMHPNLYKLSNQQNFKVWKWYFTGLLQGIVIFFLTFFIFTNIDEIHVLGLAV